MAYFQGPDYENKSIQSNEKPQPIRFEVSIWYPNLLQRNQIWVPITLLS